MAAARRNAASFGTFYERNAATTFGYFRRRCRDTQDAYDLVAETFAEALTEVGRFDPDRGSPQQWLHGIARNKFRRYVRRGEVDRRARQKLGIREARLSPDEIIELDHSIDLRVLSTQLDDAIAALPAGISAAIRLRLVEDLSYEEVAADLGISAVSARKRVSRGLATLSTTFGSNPFDTHD